MHEQLWPEDDAWDRTHADRAPAALSGAQLVLVAMSRITPIMCLHACNHWRQNGSYQMGHHRLLTLFIPCSALRVNVKILHSRGHGAPVPPPPPFRRLCVQPHTKAFLWVSGAHGSDDRCINYRRSTYTGY